MQYRPARGAAALYLVVTLASCGSTPAEAPDVGAPDAAHRVCAMDAECDDHVFCNGVERCAPGATGATALGCVGGIEPCSTGRRCDEAMSVCGTSCDVTHDADGDGVLAVECGGQDCDDGDAHRFPANPEVCDVGGHDEDCDPSTVGQRDTDGDGHTDAACCNGSGASATCGDDCNDTDPSTFPGATEVCDLGDDDCDGSADEGVSVAGFVDRDGDLHGDPAMPLMACPGLAHFSTTNDDCDDASPTIFGGEVEVCDTLDNDCDGIVDESPSSYTWYVDHDHDGFGDPNGETRVSCIPVPGFSIIATDCNDMLSGVSPAASEACNGRDDDCNGLLDFVIAPGDLEDDDADGQADARCPAGSDCNDRDPTTYSGAAEICDGRDNDCDGVSDNGTADAMWYPDRDGDGWAAPAAVAITACAQPPGHVLRVGDCDDSDPHFHPDALDPCDGGLDQDCDMIVDEDGDRIAWFPDVDGDTFGDATRRTLACARPTGFLALAGDCNDADDMIHPGVTESCDAVDDDCDALVDEGFPSVTCGLGACRRSVATCAGGTPASCMPGTAAPSDVCDGVDDDCDGTVDDEPEAGNSCGDPTATIARCVSGACVVDRCTLGHGDCNGAASDGCEGNLTTDASNCGACGRACRVGASVTCSAGHCSNEPVRIGAGEGHTCVVLGDGGVWCWGGNGRGQLGDGTTTTRPFAARVTLAGAAVDVDGGLLHTCAVLGNGDLECWGAGTSNQLGTMAADSALPIDELTTDAARVSCGDTHCCYLTRGGGVRCFGSVANSQCGVGPTSCGGGCVWPPALVPAVGVASVVAAGSVFTISAEVSPTTQVEEWGTSLNGCLGNNTFGSTSDTQMTRTTGLIRFTEAITDLDAGRDVSCVARAIGDVWCTGSDAFEQLGNGPGGGSQPYAALVLSPSGMTGVVDLAAGRDHVCARTAVGDVFCWGRNTEAQADPTSAAMTVPAPLQVVLPSPAVAIAAGLSHTCAILDTQRVVCWGANTLGQLGVGDTAAHAGIVFVTGLP